MKQSRTRIKRITRKCIAAARALTEMMTKGEVIRHPGGGGRLSRYTRRPISAKAETMTAKNETPRRERQRAIPSAQSAQSSPIASLTLATCTPRNCVISSFPTHFRHCGGWRC
ncbi:MAG: hypothetical protein PUG32_04575 [Bacteroidales bacterium]|nr:hypothetical protein [Bacteroidales bacterium]